ncbi:peptidyl-tRNA hydrolase [Candidatus Magnetoovum chiemensis]|nr:peptidyl-tRNA hydrolase [Candidatus Magnetoovum chiemensis]
MAADILSMKHRIVLNTKEDVQYGRGSINNNDVIVVKPLTYMNLSGSVVIRVIKYSAASIDSLVVIHDDLDIETGRLKLKRGGSSGGHKGVQSIIDALGGSKDFIRVKIGIGRDSLIPAEDYVLGRFTKDEREIIEETAYKACDAIYTIISDGLDKAMNLYN